MPLWTILTKAPRRSSRSADSRAGGAGSTFLPGVRGAALMPGAML